MQGLLKVISPKMQLKIAMGLDDLFKGVALKKNLKVSDKKKRALDKIPQFTNKVAGEWVVPPRKGKENTLLKAETKLKI